MSIRPSTSHPPEATPLGILGGTFDPIHSGHLRLAEEAREALGLGGVRLIPAGDPPHRSAPMTSAEHRLAMVNLAIADNPGFSADDGEVTARGKSYTVLTLQRLRSEYGERPLVLLLGADAFLGLMSWHRWQEILDLAHIAVATRAGSTLDGMNAELASYCRTRMAERPAALRASPAGRILRFEMTPLMISASLIRSLIGQGLSPRYLLPDSVLDYIGRHLLYHPD